MESEDRSPIDSDPIIYTNRKKIDKDKLILSINSILLVVILVAASMHFFVLNGNENPEKDSSENSSSISITWSESQYMPRHPECVDDSNGQDLPEFGIGYEPSISITSNGNMFITAHKDLRLSLIHI